MSVPFGSKCKLPLTRVSASQRQFSGWWQVLGSNQRRLSRQIYRPPGHLSVTR